MTQRIFLTLFLFLLTAAPARAVAPEGAWLKAQRQSLRDQLTHQLQAEGYFRNASCRELANGLLALSGLPRLGATGIVRGIRDDVLRSGEDRNPPEFSDGITYSSQLESAVHYIAKSRGPHEWVLAINRKQRILRHDKSAKTLEIRVVHRFHVEEKQNYAACDWEGMRFDATELGTSRQFSITMDQNSCLDLLLKGQPDYRGMPSLANATIRILRKECLVGGQFSLQAKRAIAKYY